MDNKKIMTTAIIAMVLVGAGAFYGGTLYEKNSLSSQGMLRAAGGTNFAGGPGGAAGQGRRMGGNAGANGAGGFVTGQVIAQDSTSVTVKTTDGSSKIIFYSGSTTIGKTVPGSASDLTTGEQIRANGTANPDGSVAAQNIQILPAQQPQQGGQQSQQPAQ